MKAPRISIQLPPAEGQVVGQSGPGHRVVSAAPGSLASGDGAAPISGGQGGHPSGLFPPKGHVQTIHGLRGNVWKSMDHGWKMKEKHGETQLWARILDENTGWTNFMGRQMRAVEHQPRDQCI